MTTIQDAVRAWARGIYTTEAGVELLIRQGKSIYEGAPWLIDLRDNRALDVLGVQHHGDDRTHVGIDVDTLLYESGVWSGGEQRVVRIAASLLGGPPVELHENLTGIDRKSLELVLAAIAHANGSHEDSEWQFSETGAPTRMGKLDTLFPWPTPA